MEAYFVLDDRGEPRLEPDKEAWARWFETADRGIARTTVSPEVTVLTTFRGVDEGPQNDEVPCLFDTVVFGGVLDGEALHHRSRGEALEAHARLAEWCRVGTEPDCGITDEMLR
jgi:hypothetical protein